MVIGIVDFMHPLSLLLGLAFLPRPPGLGFCSGFRTSACVERAAICGMLLGLSKYGPCEWHSLLETTPLGVCRIRRTHLFLKSGKAQGPEGNRCSRDRSNRARDVGTSFQAQKRNADF